MGILRGRVRWIVAVVLFLVVSFSLAGSASAHKHYVTTGDGETVYIANGQNHWGFTDQGDGTTLSCEGIKPTANVGPAGYGLETAHHGPDLEPGQGDGCYTTYGDSVPSEDVNPAIDT